MKYKRSVVVPVRQKCKFLPDESRVITKIFGLEKVRIYKVFDRILKLSEDEAANNLNMIVENFACRHKDIKRVFKDNFDTVNQGLDITIYNGLPLNKKLLIGSYFTLEYSIESAALFNPSIVSHPDQKGLKPGEMRVIISFRAVGEGHMSSVVFRSGILNKSGNLTMDETSHLVEKGKVIESVEYSKDDFNMKLRDMGQDKLVEGIFDQLLDDFTLDEMTDAITHFKANNPMTPKHDRAIDTIHWLARSNYEMEFDMDIDLSERVIFPRSTTDVRAIEDARFVEFVSTDGSRKYYGTYTAYNGHSILPQIIETTNFYRFNIHTLMGGGSQNKGMALFPEKIKDKYAMISRNDAENIYIMFSENINYWKEPILLREPKFDWEFIQIGNSGSPLKTEKGWLLLTHGVGPVRIYTIGAILLDLQDPTKVIGEIQEPILIPEDDERNGYVPNVVYSCGGMIHNEFLILPYAASDTRSGIVKFKVKELLDAMVAVDPNG